MTDRPSLELLLRQLYADRTGAALEQLCSHFAPEVRFRIAGTSDGKPISIAANGIERVRPWLSMLVKTFRIFDHEILSMLVDGERASVHWSANIHSRITGAQVRTEVIDLVEFRDSQIVSYTEFFVPR
jgi:ketosteroid isomerase-like protein